jgi:hypothetical protein
MLAAHGWYISVSSILRARLSWGRSIHEGVAAREKPNYANSRQASRHWMISNSGSLQRLMSPSNSDPIRQSPLSLDSLVSVHLR